MIISKTPFRISFFGGGTDYPVWFREHGGQVLSTTIDKYCYLSVRYFPPFFPYKHRIVYSKIETVNDIGEILHPAVKATLEFFKIEKGLSIHHDGDLPARTGLGSSSSFTVGLLHALHGLQGQNISKEELAREAIHLERDMLKENVGSQDQVAVAYGGLNKLVFSGANDVSVQPIAVSEARRKELESHLALYFTGFSRYASEVAKEQIEKTPQKQKELQAISDMVDQGIDILQNEKVSILGFGKLLGESWQLKRSLTDKISTVQIDALYERAVRAGAVGGKLLGAGGGGFMLLFIPPDKQQNVREALKDLLEAPFHFERGGSQIIYRNSTV
ncbi:MAG: kinase [Candidatus Wildermuthbacteria bacterium RIFCSPLOWO2_02_FULL_47_9c]|uniref:GHMP kinase n=2 Tax=Parcubacteria group TaxID=1794811 RepID=A0A837IKQ4_9BACT|nr:MAG: GHMP kinase [Candidatus Yanofskybacteria bacterium GW2011_GWC1_48_11]KKW04084.1 MAG: GHMP kinase [Parcubacteria group bacterium GW2011_GWB1_49_12]KKW08814.1 MAG: GHMP kinase [Parcubacteria group bacterium GW2011_GWA1_49_26]KKW14289.1 MAG: GHMP kinase [Parcubacteria group bacterium GW2011_GWA2_50_10]OHA61741.1 MAG: kinase [Candidatus Wildermuthbacteria bacterium GWA1_49_26]OHA65568.1 MAG: kinase [Candidatus Wildermuthbacteria bacterium RIFCSPHIGHO2_01_FULL_50_47]OHA69629.1 MAG: kinase 